MVEVLVIAGRIDGNFIAGVEISVTARTARIGNVFSVPVYSDSDVTAVARIENKLRRRDALQFAAELFGGLVGGVSAAAGQLDTATAGVARTLTAGVSGPACTRKRASKLGSDGDVGKNQEQQRKGKPGSHTRY